MREGKIVNRKISLVLVWCVLILVACPGSGGNTNTGNTVSVEIVGNPKDTTILVGSSYEVTAFASNAKGEPDVMGTHNLSYVSSDPSIASISSQSFQGKVTALKVGTTTLTAKVGSIQSKPLLLKVIAFDPNALPALPSATTAVGKVLQFSDSNVNIVSTGGSFTSDDGILTVVVPAGAFAPGTGASFEITKLENKMPSGVGLAYRIGACCGGSIPTLLKPIELQFLAESDGLELDANNLQIAHQGANGTWEAATTPQITPLLATRAAPTPTVSKVSVTTDKLGDFTLSHNATLMPLGATVKTGQSIKLWVVKQTSISTPGSSDFKPVHYEHFPASNWQVSGAGQITPSATNSAFATYKAPNVKPNPNIVSVTTTVNDGGHISNLYRTITIEDSFAWMNVKFAGQVHRNTKTTSTSETLDGNVLANYFANGTHTEYFRPTLNYAGSGFADLKTKGAVTDYYDAKVSYHFKFQDECVCTPNTGIITKQIDAVFTAHKNILADEAKTLLNWAVQTDGNYQAVALPFGLVLEGDYTYHYNEIYPCGDRAQRPAIDKQSKATMTVAIDNSADAKIVGVTNPISPGFLEGGFQGVAHFGSPVPAQADVPMILGGADFYGSLQTSFWADVASENKTRVSSPDILGLPPVPASIPSVPTTVFPISPVNSITQKVKPRC
jgi:Bacterial Ig-like domain (group 2)